MTQACHPTDHLFTFTVHVLCAGTDPSGHAV